MSRKRFSLIMAIVCFTIAAAAIGGFVSEAYAQEPGQTVVGKATIPAGTTLAGFAQVAPGSYTEFEFKSFREQVVYIIKRTDAVYESDGTTVKVPSGYILDATGFKHFCSHHGEEVMDGGMIGVPDKQVEADNITIAIFPNIMNNN
jgi:hypothetical protein